MSRSRSSYRVTTYWVTTVKTLTMRVTHWLAALFALSALVLIASGPAEAQETGPLTVDKTTVRAGETFTVSGSGCVPGAVVNFGGIRGDINDPEVALIPADTQADADGNWSGMLQIPAGTSPGPIDVSARCAPSPGNPQFFTTRITVSDGELAFTGSATMMLAAVAGLAITAGTALLASRPLAVRWCARLDQGRGPRKPARHRQPARGGSRSDRPQ